MAAVENQGLSANTKTTESTAKARHLFDSEPYWIARDSVSVGLTDTATTCPL